MTEGSPCASTGTSDDELVAAAKTGDRAAFDTLARRYAKTAMLVALAYVRDPDRAEDVAQDSLVKAWTALDRCRDPARFGAWLSAIVRRTALNARTKTERRLRIMQLLPWGIESLPRSNAADDGLHQGRLRTELRMAVDALPPRQREILLLHDLEGRNHHELADLLGITPATVRKHLSDARARMRELLSKNWRESV